MSNIFTITRPSICSTIILNHIKVLKSVLLNWLVVSLYINWPDFVVGSILNISKKSTLETSITIPLPVDFKETGKLGLTPQLVIIFNSLLTF
jgi:hypothetical protein